MSPAPNPTFPGLGWALGLLAAAFGAQVAVAVGLSQLWGGRPDLTLLTGFGNLIALSAVLVFGFWKSGEAPPFTGSAGVTAPFWAGIVLTAVGGTVVLGELANLAAWAVPLPPDLARLFNQLTGGNPLGALFTLAIVAPLTEEALFRGLLLRGFARRYGIVPGLVMSSALFALFHLNVWQALVAFLAGLYLGWLFLSTRSLVYPMAAHALFNGLPVLLAAVGLTVTGYNTPTVPGAVEFQPFPWDAAGLLVLGTGLWLTKRWTPLSPPGVSDTVSP